MTSSGRRTKGLAPKKKKKRIPLSLPSSPVLTAAELGAVARKPSPQPRAAVSLWRKRRGGKRVSKKSTKERTHAPWAWPAPCHRPNTHPAASPCSVSRSLKLSAARRGTAGAVGGKRKGGAERGEARFQLCCDRGATGAGGRRLERPAAHSRWPPVPIGGGEGGGGVREAGDGGAGVVRASLVPRNRESRGTAPPVA